MPARRLVCFDFDGTLVNGFPPEAPFVWRVLHSHFGCPGEALEEMRRRFFAGQCTYDEWFHHDVKLLAAAGADRAGIAAAVAGLRAVDGASQVISRLKAEGFIVSLLSGSVDVVVDRFFPDRPFDDMLLNRFLFDETGRLSGGVATPYDVDAKADGLAWLARRHGVAMRDTVFVGDSFNDVEVARAAGLSIAFNCRDERLAAVATHVIPWPATDLRVILPLLGLAGGDPCREGCRPHRARRGSS